MMAFQILSGKGSKLQVKPLFIIHPSHENIHVGIQISVSIETQISIGL
jgi:hypothetical protein